MASPNAPGTCEHSPLMGTITPLQRLDDATWVCRATCERCKKKFTYAKRPARELAAAVMRRTTIIEETPAQPDAISEEYQRIKKQIAR